MNKDIIAVIASIIILLIGLVGCADKIRHENLTPDDINMITVSYIDLEGELAVRNMEKDEIVTFLDYYNQCSSIRNNKEFAGMVTLETSITIYTNTEHGGASIIDSGEDFEIQAEVGGNNVSYWVKQAEIDAYLEQISNPGDGAFRAD